MISANAYTTGSGLVSSSPTFVKKTQAYNPEVKEPNNASTEQASPASEPLGSPSPQPLSPQTKVSRTALPLLLSKPTTPKKELPWFANATWLTGVLMTAGGLAIATTSLINKQRSLNRMTPIAVAGTEYDSAQLMAMAHQLDRLRKNSSAKLDESLTQQVLTSARELNRVINDILNNRSRYKSSFTSVQAEDIQLANLLCNYVLKTFKTYKHAPNVRRDIHTLVMKLYGYELIDQSGAALTQATFKQRSGLASFKGASRLLRHCDIYGRDQARFLSRGLVDVFTNFTKSQAQWEGKKENLTTEDYIAFLKDALQPVTRFYQSVPLNKQKPRFFGIKHPFIYLQLLFSSKPMLPVSLSIEDKVDLLYARLNCNTTLNRLNKDSLRHLLYSLNGAHPLHAGVDKASSTLAEVIQGVGLTLSEQLKANHT
ncbi:MAG: hypothetical protein ACKO34_04815 [Vampirovibrionales bacterium]